MSSTVVSKEVILEHSRNLIQQQGWEAINIRTLAATCDVSVGTIYNYFASKAELVTATIESIWFDIFHISKQPQEFESFISCIEWIHNCVQQGMKKYPNFFHGHSMSFVDKEKATGKQVMQQSWNHIKQAMYFTLQKDTNVRQDAFNDTFTAQKFIDVVFELLLVQIQKENNDNSIILEIIKRSIY